MATRSITIVGLLLALALSTMVSAQVTAEVESDRVFEGIPFTVTVTIRDADDYEPPAFPSGEGYRVTGPPSRNTMTQMSVYGGQIRQVSTITLSYSLVADRTGPLVIPALGVRVDGTVVKTPPIPVTVMAAEGGDLVEVSVLASRDEIFVGEPVELILRVLVKRYEDHLTRDRPLSPDDTWSLIDATGSTWGPFAETMQDLQRGQARLDGRTVMRPGDDGLDEAFHLFELPVRDWPRRAGPLELEPVRVVMRYPVRLQRQRSGLLSRGGLRVERWRPVVATAAAPAVEVLPVPEAGRPDWYAGAVGRFDFDVAATPREVAVGEPITLTLTVRDRTPGGTELDLLAPPRLLGQPGLEPDLRLSTDPPSGLVEERGGASGGREVVKVFTTTVRATHTGVDAIPPIRFAWFDPRERSFQSVASAPIPITVTGAAAVALGDLESAAPPVEDPSTELTEVESGLRAGAWSESALLAQVPSRIGVITWFLLVTPPLVWLGLVTTRFGARRRAADPAGRRRRAAGSTARRRLAAAAESAVPAEDIAGALTNYVADRVGKAAGALTAVEAIAHLRDRSASVEVVDQTEALLADCERARYGAAGTDDDLLARARTCLERLEREALA